MFYYIKRYYHGVCFCKAYTTVEAMQRHTKKRGWHQHKNDGQVCRVKNFLFPDMHGGPELYNFHMYAAFFK